VDSNLRENITALLILNEASDEIRDIVKGLLNLYELQAEVIKRYEIQDMERAYMGRNQPDNDYDN